MKGLAVVAVVVAVFAQVPDDRRGARESGTARIEGTVVAADGHGLSTPGRRAIVTLTGAALPIGKSAVTDEHGRFVLDRVPAGRFMLTATKPAYLPGAYGSARPGRSGVPVVLAAGQRMADVVITVTRGAAVGGTIREASSSPVFGVTVTAYRVLPDGSAAASARTTSDDRGRYRIFGLNAGDYLVSAERPAGVGQDVTEMTSDQVDRKLAALRARGRAASPPAGTAALPPASSSSFAPVFYPRAFSAADASRIPLTLGDDRAGVDIILDRVRTMSVRGSLSGALGAAPVTISLTQSGPSLPAMGGPPILRSRPAGDGPFEFGNVRPGTYLVTALESGRVRFAQAAISVAGNDVHGVSLVLQPALRFTGRLVFEGTRLRPPEDLTTIRVMLELAATSTATGGGGRGAATGGSAAAATTDARGDFIVDGVVPGTYHVTTSLTADPEGWWLRSAVLSGRDMLDVPLQVDGSTTLAGAVLTFSDRHTMLSGSLEVPAGRAAGDYHIVVFPADRAMWLPRARRIQSARPGTDGVYLFRDLPPGTYRLVALTDLAPDDLLDSTFFESILPASIAVPLAEGERKTQALRVGR